MKPYFLLIFLLLPTVFALNIDLSINKVMTVDTKYFLYNDSLGTKLFSGELLNSGSLPCGVQTRLDVFAGNETVFTAWSPERGLVPGNVYPFAFYWLPSQPGTYEARLRIYYGNEVEEKYMNVTATASQQADGFSIDSVRTLSNFLLVDVTSKVSGDAVLIPSGYEQGMVFTQGLLTAKAGEKQTTFLSYKTPVWYPQDLNLTIVSKDGTYGASKLVHLQRDTSISALIFNLILGLGQ